MRKTHVVLVGNVKIGGNNDIAVQSMTNVPTKDVNGNIEQIKALVESGCEVVRLSVPTMDDVIFFEQIKNKLRAENIQIPLVADVHFLPNVAYKCLSIADKVRINPGNFTCKCSRLDNVGCAEKTREFLGEFLCEAKKTKTPIRIGINGGSLSKNILVNFGNTEKAMIESAKEYIEVAQSVGFHDIIFSFKSSNLNMTIAAYRLADETFAKNNLSYPLHVGVTEAGYGQYGMIKSSIAIGSLLADGISDTIRVSLTGSPIDEISVAKDILQATGRRYFYPEIISCPSCGRTRYDIASVVANLEKNIRAIKTDKHIKIAIMGCIVNGLGEACDSDLACVGTDSGAINIYSRGMCISKNVAISSLFDVLNNLVVGLAENK